MQPIPTLRPDFRDLVEDQTSPVAKMVLALARRGEATATELAGDVAMARSSVSALLTDLRQKNVVLETDRRQSGVGRPTTMHSLHPELGTAAGVLLGLGEIRLSLCDVTHTVLTDETFLIDAAYTPEDALTLVHGALIRHCASLGKTVSSLIGVGLAVSAPVTKEGVVLFSSSLPGWSGVEIGSAFARRLGCPVHVENESHCGALAEMIWGAAKGEPDFAMFKFDLGVGGAVVIDGVLRRGANGCGGEFGHLTLDPKGPLCGCGNRGCLSTYTSGSHILLAVGKKSGRPLALADFVKEAREGNRSYRRLLEDAAEMAGHGVAMIGTALNPPLFLITGGLAQAGPLFLDPLRESYVKNTFCKQSALLPEQRTRIEPGFFLGNDNVLGAAALVLRQLSRTA